MFSCVFVNKLGIDEPWFGFSAPIPGRALWDASAPCIFGADVSTVTFGFTTAPPCSFEKFAEVIALPADPGFEWEL